MFRIGEKRKVAKVVPCIFKVAVLRAETEEEREDDGRCAAVRHACAWRYGLDRDAIASMR